MNRIGLTWIVCVVLVTMGWTAQAQGDDGQSDSVARIEDPPGDVEVRTQAGHTVNDPDYYHDIDILAATMRLENATHLRLDMKLAERPSTTGTEGSHRFYFAFGGLAYRVQFDGCRGGPFALEVATSVDAPDEAWSFVKCLEGYDLTAREDADITAFVPHTYIQDSYGGPLRGGAEVTSFFAATTSRFSFGAFTASDRAPDQGTAAGIRVPLADDAAADGFQIFAPFPVQFSNGGAGTILFNVVADNLADEETVLLMGTSGTRADWTVLYPDRLVLEPNASVSVPILVNVPFSHTHGATDHFELIASKQSDPTSKSSLQLGVHYPLVPQPAGHHPIIFLHSDESDQSSRVLAWMNPRHEALDESASYAPASPSLVRMNGTQAEAEWFIPLKPELRIGLSFDPTAEGFFTAAIVPGAPVADARIHTTLLLCDPGPGSESADGTADCGVGSWRVLGTAEPAQVTGNAGQVLEFEQTLDFSQAPARYDYERGANLYLRVLMQRSPGEPGFPTDQETGLVTRGSSMEVPFLEYGHPIGAEYQAARSLEVSVDKPSFRLINPGRTLSFNLTVENTGKDFQNVQLDVQGHNADWAWFRNEDPTATIDPGASWTQELLVTPPPEAVGGEFAELAVVAQNADDSSAAALLGLRVMVTTTEPIPDEFSEDTVTDEAVENAPNLGAALLLATMITLAVSLRRRDASG